MRPNVAGQFIGAQMITIADGSFFAGAVTVYVTGNNGVQTIGSVGGGACTHKGRGYHSYTPSQAETNSDHIAFTFQGTGATTATVQVYPAPLAPTAIENADAHLARDMSLVAGAAARSPLNAHRAARNKVDFASTPGTMKVMLEDDVTPAWTAAVTTNPAAAPITVIDPA